MLFETHWKRQLDTVPWGSGTCLYHTVKSVGVVGTSRALKVEKGRRPRIALGC